MEHLFAARVGRQIVQIRLDVRHRDLRHVVAGDLGDGLSGAAGLVAEEEVEKDQEIPRVVEARQRRGLRRDAAEELRAEWGQLRQHLAQELRVADVPCVMIG